MLNDITRTARSCLITLVLPLVALLGAPASSAEALPTGSLPPIRHVFVIVLENKSFSEAFGSNGAAPYLARTAPAQGALLKNYYATGHWSLDNYIALVSGQAPNPATQRDCPLPTEFKPSSSGLDAEGQLPGVGCVYPTSVRTVADQLEKAHLTWKGYMEDLDRDPARDRPATCTVARIGRTDLTERESGGDEYASKHDPFVYFHTILDHPMSCAAHVVNLKVLRSDLRSVATTPNYSFITPNLCHDGHDPSCYDGKPGGLQGINGFLAKWVPRITRSPAFREDGLLLITFDESDGSPPDGFDACCGEKPLPGAPDAPGFNGPGGGRVGAVALSPFIRPGTVSTMPYNHYALLRTIEDLFGVGHLGYAGQPDLRPFGADVFSGYRTRPSRR
jgi:phosphatidylinositol-3-phosphatase